MNLSQFWVDRAEHINRHMLERCIDQGTFSWSALGTIFSFTVRWHTSQKLAISYHITIYPWLVEVAFACLIPRCTTVMEPWVTDIRYPLNVSSRTTCFILIFLPVSLNMRYIMPLIFSKEIALYRIRYLNSPLGTDNPCIAGSPDPLFGG
ncbi:hypothetical protein PoB_006534400 [Plakobranchus ocellatus]|uniref:Odorant receptor n=1 Tax=Plakobranchus ocellatus TaxID=259542 RepID=A0AAV4D3W2_9GAST|nr:hypothetical protein PoB_006534400 [Plakobranchus ocellatus]